MNFPKKNRKILTRLSSLFLIQILLIFAFVLFGALVSNNNVDVSEPWSSGNVKFISKSSDSVFQPTKPEEHQYKTPTYMKIIRNENFSNQFVTIYENATISSDIPDRIEIKRLCFRDGVEPQRASQDVNNKTEIDYSDLPACHCLPEWHGAACSEPEIIWRAFMASRQPMVHPPKITRHPHNVFYIIMGVTSLSLETLEVQILELAEIVSVFVVCDLVKSEDPSLLIRHQMNRGLLRTYKEQILLVKDETCSGANIYRHMKKILGSQMKSLDVLIYGRSDEILNQKAVNYFKWHNNWIQPLRFRLKWNVYGFFFQHPDSTVLSSLACQLNVLEQFYKSDPDKILENHATSLVVGDLNHYGGWFCEYCHQPIDIIKRLHLDAKSLNNKSHDPLKGSYHRKPTINIEFVQNLIQNGLYIDGKLELLKIRHYHDEKYFAPESVKKNKQQFFNIISNFYSNWDDDLDGSDY